MVRTRDAAICYLFVYFSHDHYK
jgi:cofilin